MVARCCASRRAHPLALLPASHAEIAAGAGGPRLARPEDFGEPDGVGRHRPLVNVSATLDRTGVAASILCAIHCAVAPMLLIVAPTLGGGWVHPLAHLGIAGLVLPIAGVALRKGYFTHGLRWVAWLGGLGIALVLLGAAYPYFNGAADGCSACCDQCCPSYLVDEATGEERLHIPPASIITLCGGVALVAAHVANLRGCARCCA